MTPVVLPYESKAYREAWDGYMEVRRTEKFTMTEYAIKLLVGKLDKMGERDGIEALQRAALTKWKSVFPPQKSETEEQRIKSAQRKKQRTQETHSRLLEDKERIQTQDGKSAVEMFKKRHKLNGAD